MKRYSFCESLWAGSQSPWHIRIVPEGAELKTGGGIQTGSLCGHVDAGKGWDLEIEVASWGPDHVCKKCYEAFKAETGVPRILITKRANDYLACLEGNASKSGHGSTPNAAVGHLIRSWPDTFQVHVVEVESQPPPKPPGRKMVARQTRQS